MGRKRIHFSPVKMKQIACKTCGKEWTCSGEAVEVQCDICMLGAKRIDPNAPIPEVIETPKVKGKRGRPRKNPLPAPTIKEEIVEVTTPEEVKPKRGRGRPRKNPILTSSTNKKTKLSDWDLEELKDWEMDALTFFDNIKDQDRSEEDHAVFIDELQRLIDKNPSNEFIQFVGRDFKKFMEGNKKYEFSTFGWRKKGKSMSKVEKKVDVKGGSGKRGRKATVGSAVLGYIQGQKGEVKFTDILNVYSAEREKLGKKATPEIETRNCHSTLYVMVRDGKIREVQKKSVYSAC